MVELQEEFFSSISGLYFLMTSRRGERAMYSTELYSGMTFQHLTCPSTASVFSCELSSNFVFPQLVCGFRYG